MAEQQQQQSTEQTTEPAYERKVIVAMDGSENSNYAFDWYMKNVHKKTDRVIFVHVPEYHTVVQSPMVMADVTVLTDLWQEEEKRIKKLLASLGQQMKDHGIGGSVKSISGSPGEVITKESKGSHAAMIVTGTRGMGTIRRTLLGSVSDYIIHHAHVPVLVVRHPDQKHEHHN